MANLVTGGAGWKRFKQEVMTAQAGRSEILVGWGPEARYEDGTPVAMAAAANEWGTERIPERPFIRPAIRSLKGDLRAVLPGLINTRKMTLSAEGALQAGKVVRDALRREIDTLRNPPNRPSTIKGKEGGKPLVDKGKMRMTISIRLGRHAQQ